MPEAEIRLGKANLFILDLFNRKRTVNAQVQKSRAEARYFDPPNWFA
jgi:hypothetical protein